MNRIPSEANLSIQGVLISFCPYFPRSPHPRSSATISIIFGVSGDTFSPGFGGNTALGCCGDTGIGGVGVGCA